MSTKRFASLVMGSRTLERGLRTMQGFGAIAPHRFVDSWLNRVDALGLWRWTPLGRPRVGRRVDLAEGVDGDECVDLGGRDGGVPEQFLDHPDVRPALD